jgi:hypothetical protein
MSTAAPAATRRAAARALGRLSPALPWALPVGAAGTAWAVLATTALGDPGRSGDHLVHVGASAAMVVAMMGVLAVPACRAVAAASLWPLAPRAVTCAFAAFVAEWVVVGLGLHLAADLAIAVVPAALVVALAGAAWVATTASPRRDRALASCRVSGPIRPRSARGDALDVGARAARRCAATCVPAMAVVAAAPTTPAMAAVTAVVLVERLVEPRPRWLVVAGGAAVTVAVVLVA